MPSPADVRAQLIDVLVAVVDVDPAAVRDDARLRDLGVDSLSAVEVADEMGRRFGIHLSDDTVDRVVTVGDAVSAVVDHPGAADRPVVGAASAPAAVTSSPSSSSHDGLVGRTDAFWRLATWFVVGGAVLGLLLGFGGTAVVKATGIGGVDLPPIAAPTTPTPSATASASPTPTPTTPSPKEEDDEPTFTVESDQVAPGQRFGLSGRFPELGEGEILQVEVRDAGDEWDEFPVSVQTGERGRFETQIYTSRTGEREFRMTHPGSGASTPARKVRIG